MEIFKSIVTNVLTALYQPFWFAVLLTIFILFFYMYAYHPIDTGKGRVLFRDKNKMSSGEKLPLHF